LVAEETRERAHDPERGDETMRRTPLVTALLAGMALAPAGCRTVAPVAGPAPDAAGFAYGAGKASQEFAFPTPVVQPAIAAALNDLGVRQVRQRHDGPSRIFEGTTADGRPATATLRPGNGAARVTVRIGWFGDEPFSRAVMERLGIRLGNLPPAPIPAEPPSSPGANPYFSRQAIPDASQFRDQAEAPYRDSAVPRD
jgi:hypothetical protein